MSQTNQSESAPLFGGVLAAVKDVVMESVVSVAEGIKDVVEDTTHYRITKDREPQNLPKTEERLEEIHVKAEIAKERLATDAELVLEKIVDVTENVVDSVVGNVHNVKEGVKENAALVKDVVAEEVTEVIEGAKDVVEDNTNYIVTKDRLPQNQAVARKRVEEIKEHGEVAKGLLVGNAEQAVNSAIEGLKEIVEDTTKFAITKDSATGKPIVVEQKTVDLTNDVNKAIERAQAAQPKIVENVTVDLTDRLKNLVPKIEENITVDLTDRLKNLVPKDEGHEGQEGLKENANWEKEGIKNNVNYAKDNFGENASQKENTHFTQNVLADNIHFGLENPSEVLAKGLPTGSTERIPEYSPNINVVLNDPLRFERAADK